MSVSKVQLEIWKARDELDRKLAGMSRQERREYFNGAMGRFEAATGVKLHLKTISRPPQKVAR